MAVEVVVDEAVVGVVVVDEEDSVQVVISDPDFNMEEVVEVEGTVEGTVVPPKGPVQM